MNISFSGKRALVTGAASGIGKGIVLELIRCGAKVIGVDRDPKSLEVLKQNEPTVEIHKVDLANWKETEEVLRKIGPVDLLVNNAGIVILGPLVEIQEEDFDKTFAVNMKAMVNVTRLVVKGMLENNISGAIVNISSQASKVGLLNHTLYCASKGAVDAFTRVVALEYGGKSIRINAVNPTVVMTDLGRKAWSKPEDANPMLEKIPLKRFGEVEDVVNTVLFLLSDKASMITGSCLAVDGGFLAG